MIDCINSRELWFFPEPIYADNDSGDIVDDLLIIVSKEAIISNTWASWISRMTNLRRYKLATIENCIKDYLTTNWAVKLEKNELRRILEQKAAGAKIHFYKKDGSARIMYCTLNPDLIPVELSGSPAKELPHVLTVWDLEVEGWRNINFSKEVDILEDDHV